MSYSQLKNHFKFQSLKTITCSENKKRIMFKMHGQYWLSGNDYRVISLPAKGIISESLKLIGQF